MTEKRKTNKFPVSWVDARFIDGKAKGEYIGICSVFDEPAFLGTGLHTSIINNLFCSAGKCEESSGCLNTKCEFNDATIDSYKKRWGLKKAKFAAQFFEEKLSLPDIIKIDKKLYKEGMVTHKND